MYKSAVIGLGVIGPNHCKSYKSTREIQLGAVVDIDPVKAEKYGKEYGVPWFTDVRKVLRRKDIDFVDVCVPSGLHGTIAIAAARAGKHCICEKPMDVTPQRCDHVIRAFQKSGTVYGGIFQHRFADDNQRAKKAIDDGRLGRLTQVSCSTPWWRPQEYYDSGDWRGTWKLDGGGCLMNQGVHAIDLLAWLCGPIASITARTARLAHERIEVEDVAVAVIEFASGALGVMTGSTASFPGNAPTHEISGTKGQVFLRDDHAVYWKLADEMEAEKAAQAAPATATPAVGAAVAAGSAAAASVGAAADPTQVSGDLFVRNIDAIALAAREGRRPTTSAEEHRKAVEIICAIYKSAQTGKTVRLPLKSFRPRA
jgi:UDP-N-acetyl-2-amino-2-deoxyglucuronate dehydrogenase